MVAGEELVDSAHLLVGPAEAALDVVFEPVGVHAREVTHAAGFHLDEGDQLVEDHEPVDPQLVAVVDNLRRQVAFGINSRGSQSTGPRSSEMDVRVKGSGAVISAAQATSG